MKPRVDPRDYELLLCFVLKCTRADLVWQKNIQISAAAQKKLHGLEIKRAAGWPLQYLIGTAWFYGQPFHVTPAVLIPRPATELMIEKILAAEPAETILDVGTGSGCIAVSLARNLNNQIIAVDSSAPALRVARANAKKLLPKNQRLKFYQSDLLTNIAWPRAKKIIIAANLPYLSAKRLKKISREVRHEPVNALAAGPDGLQLYQKLFRQIARRARPHQTITIFTEIDPEQKTKLAALARRELKNSTLAFFTDLAGNNRCAKIIFSL